MKVLIEGGRDPQGAGGVTYLLFIELILDFCATCTQRCDDIWSNKRRTHGAIAKKCRRKCCLSSTLPWVVPHRRNLDCLCSKTVIYEWLQHTLSNENYRSDAGVLCPRTCDGTFAHKVFSMTTSRTRKSGVADFRRGLAAVGMLCYWTMTNRKSVKIQKGGWIYIDLQVSEIREILDEQFPVESK